MIGFVTGIVCGPTALATLDAYSAQHTSQCALIEEHLHAKTAVPSVSLCCTNVRIDMDTRPYADNKRLVGSRSNPGPMWVLASRCSAGYGLRRRDCGLEHVAPRWLVATGTYRVLVGLADPTNSTLLRVGPLTLSYYDIDSSGFTNWVSYNPRQWRGTSDRLLG